MPFQNISLDRSAVTAPSTIGGQAAKNESKQKVAAPDAIPTRAVPGLTRYNPESGLVEPRAAPALAAEPAAEVALATEPAADAQSRQQAWKAQQAEKKARTDAARAVKATEGQALARDALAKGDLVSAAKALGMSPSDLIVMVNQGALGIKAEPKELSPEERRAADEQALRDEVKSLREDRDQRTYNEKAHNFILENIAPVLADKERFECIHAEGVKQIQSYAYDFMNQHYGATGEVLRAEDVLETIEQQLAATVLAGVERASKLKKAAKFFGQPTVQQTGERAARDVKDQSGAYTGASVDQSTPLDRELIQALAGQAPRETSPVGRGFSDRPAGPPSKFAFLTRAEKLAAIRAEDEAAEAAARA